MSSDEATTGPIYPAELEELATGRYGENWVSKLARDMGVSVPAVSRWKREGITNAVRAGHARTLLVDGVKPPAKRRVGGLPSPSPAEFADWINKHFRSINHASDVLGLDKDTLSAMCTGKTRNSNPYEIKPWVRHMMAGYAIKSHGELIQDGKGKVDIDRAAEMLREGQSTYAVAKEFDVSRKAIRNHQRLGKLPPSSRSAGSKFDLDKARELLLLGQPNRKVARELGVAEHTIWRHQKAGNLPRSAFTVSASRLDIGLAQKLLDAGVRVADIAHQAGVSRFAVYNAIRRGDLVRRGG